MKQWTENKCCQDYVRGKGKKVEQKFLGSDTILYDITIVVSCNYSPVETYRIYTLPRVIPNANYGL